MLITMDKPPQKLRNDHLRLLQSLTWADFAFFYLKFWFLTEKYTLGVSLNPKWCFVLPFGGHKCKNCEVEAQIHERILHLVKIMLIPGPLRLKFQDFSNSGDQVCSKILINAVTAGLESFLFVIASFDECYILKMAKITKNAHSGPGRVSK